MSIRDALQAATVTPKNGFDAWLDTLEADDRAALIEAAPLTNLTHRAFLDVVKAHGAKVGRDRVTDWRKAHGFPR